MDASLKGKTNSLWVLKVQDECRWALACVNADGLVRGLVRGQKGGDERRMT